ncbi:MAG: hypothetical protein ACXW3E_12535, partial [Thermoanaerobaculia bacterium]
LTINNDRTVEIDAIPFTLSGTAAPGSEVVVSIEGLPDMRTTTDQTGHWAITNITVPLKTGTYAIAVRSGGATVAQLMRIQLPVTSNLQRQSLIEQQQPVYPGTVTQLAGPDTWQEMTDRWRIAPPPYELDEHVRARKFGKSGASLDPYNQNLLKGDVPIPGTQDKFFVFTGVLDTLAESRTVPTPSGFSGNRSGNYPFFGSSNQNVFNQNLGLSFELYQGNTAFRPPTQRLRATVFGNLNYVQLKEVGLVKPDVRRGTSRTDGQFAVQELFYERKLADVSPNFDFVSVRVGSQPFLSDFRGFIFSDTNLGARVFGSLKSNRIEYNVAAFDRLEKDTNSGLNIWNELRDQQVGVANIFIQDFIKKGYTQEFSVHYVRDEATFKYDRNGVLVRPAPVGVFTPHEIKAIYIGQAGLGHFGRINVDHALYYVFGTDSLNPIAGPDPRLQDSAKDEVKIGAGLAAIEFTYDHDWWRPRFGLFWASGDKNPRDRTARGFDSIFDASNFAGGGFSFFNRLGIRLPPTGVALVERGSLYTSLRSSKDEGQPNYVNPGLQLATIGLDVDITPRLKSIFTANYIRLDAPQPIETILFQGGIRKELGIDVSAGLRYRPFLNQNFVIVGGAAGFKPGAGWKDIYEKDDVLYQLFTNVILTF